MEELHRTRYGERVTELPCPLQEYHSTSQCIPQPPKLLELSYLGVLMEVSLHRLIDSIIGHW